MHIGISGHRQLENPGTVKEEIKNHLQASLKKQKAGNKSFYAVSGLAIGADTLFAEAALELGIPFIAVLPFSEKEYERDFEGNDLFRFKHLLSNAARTDIVSPDPENQEQRDVAYLAYGMKIARMSDIMMLVWDGQEAKGTGGTAEIARYAKTKRKKIIRIRAYRNDISRHYVKLDQDAIKYKKRYERWWLAGILFSLAAAVLLAISVSFHGHINEKWFSTIEFVCIITALLIILNLKAGDLNKKRLNFRREAERFRVLETMIKGKFPIEEITDFEDISLAGKELEEKYIGQKAGDNSFEDRKEELLNLIHGQFDYHDNKRPKFNKTMFGVLEHSQFPLLFLFCLAVSLHTLAIWLEHFCPMQKIHGPASISLLCCLVIPPIYAAIEGYIFFKEYHKILRDSEQMKKFFSEQQSKIVVLDATVPRSLAELNEIAAKIRNNMDAEIKDWYATMKEKQNPGM